jgi:hypothetical protein
MKTGIIFKSICIDAQNCEFNLRKDSLMCDYHLIESGFETNDEIYYCSNVKACRQEMINQYGDFN